MGRRWVEVELYTRSTQERTAAHLVALNVPTVPTVPTVPSSVPSVPTVLLHERSLRASGYYHVDRRVKVAAHGERRVRAPR